MHTIRILFKDSLSSQSIGQLARSSRKQFDEKILREEVTGNT